MELFAVAAAVDVVERLSTPEQLMSQLLWALEALAAESTEHDAAAGFATDAEAELVSPVPVG